MTQEESVDYVITTLRNDHNHDDEEENELIREHLQDGKAYWVWEWVRKGNGDYYQVVKNFSFDDVLNLDVESAQDLESITKTK
jgi:hypothetical protein